MKQLLLIFLTTALVNTASSQIALRVNNSLYNTGGTILPIAGTYPVGNTKSIDLTEGSPFYNDNWSKSRIVTQKGEVYDGISVKVNLMENNIHYLDGSGNELVVSIPISEIELQDAAAGKKAHFVNGSLLPTPKKGWYLLLMNEDLALVKRFQKTFEEHRSYGGSSEYSIKTFETYHVLYNNQEFNINKAADFVQVLPAKKAEIEAQVKKLSRKLSKEDQIQSMAVYCNSLLKQN